MNTKRGLSFAILSQGLIYDPGGNPAEDVSFIISIASYSHANEHISQFSFTLLDHVKTQKVTSAFIPPEYEYREKTVSPEPESLAYPMPGVTYR
jgi:hypothetical protein